MKIYLFIGYMNFFGIDRLMIGGIIKKFKDHLFQYILKHF
jgi:hypothetical protein